MLVPKKALYIFVGALAVVALGLYIYTTYINKGSDGGSGDGTVEGGLNPDGSGNGGNGGAGGGGFFRDGDGSSGSIGGYNEKEIRRVFQWDFAGKSYQVTHDFYNSLFELYNTSAKESIYFTEIADDGEDAYYGKFITESSDVTGGILNQIVSQGTANNLTEDQMVELVMSFVHSIPFDFDKSSNVTGKKEGQSMNYPYETLFEYKGMSFDKTLLAVALLRALGYGTAVFVYDDMNHMAVGIKCPMNYSNYQSGYCYAETTNQDVGIGVIAKVRFYAAEAVSPGRAGLDIGNPKIFQITEGKEYGKIVETADAKRIAAENVAAEENRTAEVTSQIASIEKEIADQKLEVADLRDEMIEAQNDFRDAAPDTSILNGSATALSLISQMNALAATLSGDDVADASIYAQIQDLQDQLSASDADNMDEYLDEYDDFLEAKDDYLDAIADYNEAMSDYSSLTQQLLMLKIQN